MYHAVIMAVGKGERFWPESRESKPKQFLNLMPNENMLQATVRRINKLIPYQNIHIVTNPQYRNWVKEQVPMLKDNNIIIEPQAKNTAACIGLACAYIRKKDDDAYMVVLPSHHLIRDEGRFINVVDRGFMKAEEGDNLITLGIMPGYPETGYGYIKHGPLPKDLCCRVEYFVEKPDYAKAEQYIDEGNYLWNSGMFIWSVESIMKSFEKHMPTLYEGVLNIEKAIGSDDGGRVIKEEFMKLENISID